jgi:hypothetical protein
MQSHPFAFHVGWGGVGRLNCNSRSNDTRLDIRIETDRDDSQWLTTVFADLESRQVAEISPELVDETITFCFHHRQPFSA